MKRKSIMSIALALVLTTVTFTGSFAEVIRTESIVNSSIDSNLSMSKETAKQSIQKIEKEGFKEEQLNSTQANLLNTLVESAIQNTEGLELTEENIEFVKELLRDDSMVTASNDKVLTLQSVRSKRKARIRIPVKVAAAASVGNVIGSFINNLLDPGTGLANYLDRNDRFGKNGYIEV